MLQDLGLHLPVRRVRVRDDLGDEFELDPSGLGGLLQLRHHPGHVELGLPLPELLRGHLRLELANQLNDRGFGREVSHSRLHPIHSHLQRNELAVVVTHRSCCYNCGHRGGEDRASWGGLNFAPLP